MSSPVNVIKNNIIDDKINELITVRDYINKVLEIESNSFYDYVLMEYIRVQNASEVADIINNEGYRLKTDGRIGERKYISNDIIDLLSQKSEVNGINIIIFDLAKALHKFNKGKNTWSSIVRLCKTDFNLG
jgi:hypothetical protein